MKPSFGDIVKIDKVPFSTITNFIKDNYDEYQENLFYTPIEMFRRRGPHLFQLADDHFDKTVGDKIDNIISLYNKIPGKMVAALINKASKNDFIKNNKVIVYVPLSETQRDYCIKISIIDFMDIIFA